ncbi:Pre-rRNA-processing protein ipi3 [Geranomyces michiganensis]|nr:Pre-rRNA-processing protein ipi3 [Geranomyces michiganensis]
MLAEIAVTASSSGSLVYVWDLRSGAILASLKGNNSAPRTTTTLPSQCLYSDAFLAAQNDRALVNVWSWAKSQILAKFPLPEKLSALCASHSGLYCVGGGESGRLYVWEMATGRLLRTFDAHYKAVRVVRFTDDDAAFITGGEDSVANVWRIAGVIDPGTESSVVTPHASLSGHALPITDIAVGFGLFGSARIVTSSADCTCKIWEAASGDLLTTLLFPTAVTSVALDQTETRLYTGAADGKIHCTNLYRGGGGGGRDPPYGLAQGVTAGDAADPTADADEPGSTGGVFSGHTACVSSLAFSFDGSLLLSGSDDGTAIVWDTASKQAMRTFSTHKTPVTSVSVLLQPPHLGDPGAAGQLLASAVRPWQKHVADAETEGSSQRDVRANWAMPLTTGAAPDHHSADRLDFLTSVERRVQELKRVEA